MSKYRNPEADRLFQAILLLQSVDECYDFFEDACTIKEIQEIAHRFDVACQLDSGRSYNEIYRDTGVSTATICRVSRCLNYGNNGYRRAIDRLKKVEESGNGI